MKKAIFFCLTLAVASVNAQTGINVLAFKDVKDFQSYFHYTS